MTATARELLREIRNRLWMYGRCWTMSGGTVVCNSEMDKALIERIDSYLSAPPAAQAEGREAVIEECVCIERSLLTSVLRKWEKTCARYQRVGSDWHERMPEQWPATVEMTMRELRGLAGALKINRGGNLPGKEQPQEAEAATPAHTTNADHDGHMECGACEGSGTMHHGEDPHTQQHCTVCDGRGYIVWSGYDDGLPHHNRQE